VAPSNASSAPTASSARPLTAAPAAPAALPTSTFSTKTVDLSQADIASIDVGSSDVTVLGVGLGATRAEAERVLGANQRYVLEPGQFDPTWLSVYERGADGARNGHALVEYIWSPSDPKLARITIFDPFVDRLVGRTKSLMTTDAVTDGSEIRRWLRKPDASDRTYYGISYFFRRRGIIVMDVDAKEVGRHIRFALLRPDVDVSTDLSR
jgi:hypothetical protein